MRAALALVCCMVAIVLSWALLFEVVMGNRWAAIGLLYGVSLGVTLLSIVGALDPPARKP